MLGMRKQTREIRILLSIDLKLRADQSLIMRDCSAEHVIRIGGVAHRLSLMDGLVSIVSTWHEVVLSGSNLSCQRMFQDLDLGPEYRSIHPENGTDTKSNEIQNTRLR